MPFTLKPLEEPSAEEVPPRVLRREGRPWSAFTSPAKVPPALPRPAASQDSPGSSLSVLAPCEVEARSPPSPAGAPEARLSTSSAIELGGRHERDVQRTGAAEQPEQAVCLWRPTVVTRGGPRRVDMSEDTGRGARRGAWRNPLRARGEGPPERVSITLCSPSMLPSTAKRSTTPKAMPPEVSWKATPR